MIVGVGRVTLSLPGVASLKAKRSIVRRVVDRARAKFNVAFAEVDEMDSHRRAVLGFAVVSNERRHAESMLDTVFEFVETVATVPIIDRARELVPLRGELGVVAAPSWAGPADELEPAGPDGFSEDEEGPQ